MIATSNILVIIIHYFYLLFTLGAEISGSLDSMECGTVEWNNGINDPVPFTGVSGPIGHVH